MILAHVVKQFLGRGERAVAGNGRDGRVEGGRGGGRGRGRVEGGDRSGIVDGIVGGGGGGGCLRSPQQRDDRCEPETAQFGRFGGQLLLLVVLL